MKKLHWTRITRIVDCHLHAIDQVIENVARRVRAGRLHLKYHFLALESCDFFSYNFRSSK
jgi:hypothetical protein